MIKKNPYDSPYNYYSLFEINGSLNSSKKIIERYIKKYNDELNIKEMNYEDVSEILYTCERISLSCRYALGEIYKEDGIWSEETKLYFDKNFNVSVQFSNQTLRVFCPLTFKRWGRTKSLKYNYTLVQYIKAALISFQEQTGFSLLHSIPLPLCTFIVRRTTHKNSKVYDNDNMENGRIINEIFTALGYSDHPLNTDLFCHFEITDDPEKEGMEFIICSQSETNNIVNSLSSNKK